MKDGGVIPDQQRKIPIAVESTDDFADTVFHADLRGVDVRNADGTYGTVVNKYRIVTFGADFRITPFDNRQFIGYNEAVTAATAIEGTEVISYDELVDRAAVRLGYKFQSANNERSDTMAMENISPHGEEIEQGKELSPKEKLQEQLEAGVKAVMNTDAFRNWLSTSSKMFTRQYSFGNAILVWMQKPNATFTMGYEAWKGFGRNVEQGAMGAKIFVPQMAYERQTGALAANVKKTLIKQLANEPATELAVYRLGNSKVEFVLNRANRTYGLRIDGKDRGLLGGEEDLQRFIERSVLGKIPVGFTVGTVFDVTDTTVPEFLWVRKGYTKDEVERDANGKPIKNRQGEVKIRNTPERQARFQPDIGGEIAAGDPVKMERLFDACAAAAERKGIPVYLRSKDVDATLASGAKGYFSRETLPGAPKGYIVIDKTLEPTDRAAVMLHEMSHADLHGNLEKLNAQFGERVTRNMREVQAEASAFATAQQFGIETDTSSFTYLAAWSTGFQLQEFQRSLELIYKEMKSLTADIKAELDLRGLDMTLEQKPEGKLEAETVKTLCARYVDLAAQQDDIINTALNDMPSYVEQSNGQETLVQILRSQKENLDQRAADVETIYTAVKGLEAAKTREEQEMQLSVLTAATARIKQSEATFENLMEKFVLSNEQLRGNLKTRFMEAPEKTLSELATTYPRLQALSPAQITYIAKSKFIAKQYSKLLATSVDLFVARVCERAEAIANVASKNGTFVEITSCEQWTDKPLFENGTLCHPKIADKIVTASEAQLQGLRKEAELGGGYVPYSKCNMMIYTPGAKGLSAINIRVDIGDGGQTSLKDFLEQWAGSYEGRKTVVGKVNNALSEAGRYKDKITTPEQLEGAATPSATDRTAPIGKEGQSTEIWQAEIGWAKGQQPPDKQPDRDGNQGRTQRGGH